VYKDVLFCIDVATCVCVPKRFLVDVLLKANTNTRTITQQVQGWMESEFDFDLTMNDELGGKIHVHSSQINRENFRFSFVGFLLFPSSLESFVSFVSMMVMCDGDKERVLTIL